MIYDENYDGFECDYCKLDGTDIDSVHACTNKSKKCSLSKKKDACIQCAIKFYNSNLNDYIFNGCDGNWWNTESGDKLNHVLSQVQLYPVVINSFTEEAYQLNTNDNMKIKTIVNYMDVIKS